MDKTIEVSNISKSFKLTKAQMRIDKTNSNLKRAVDNISFDTYRGEIFGLLGPNGAGKTTTMRCIATLIQPDEGSILIDGIDTRNDISVKRKMAFLTGELKLDRSFTPNYLFDFFSGLYGISKQDCDKRKAELFERFGIDKFAEVKVDNLSQGMKQKLSIVVSLVHDPDIIVFDEPTNGLDVLTARTVTDFLRELKDRNKTVLVSTHIMPLVEKLCDRVGIIIDGKLVVCDTTESILKQHQGKDLEDAFFDIFSEMRGAQ